MPEYLVRWEINVDEVDSPREAAEVALEIMRDPLSDAVVFDVGPLSVLEFVNVSSTYVRNRDWVRVDLSEEEG